MQKNNFKPHATTQRRDEIKILAGKAIALPAAALMLFSGSPR
jgi:hypothetical protein